MKQIRFNPINFGISLLLMYAFFIGLFARYMPSIISLFLLLFALLCISLRKNNLINKEKTFTSLLVIVCVLVVLINRNARFSNGLIRMDFCVIIAFIAYFILCNNYKWHQCYIRNMVCFGLFYGITTIFLYIFPNIYMKYIVHLFAENAAANIRTVERGYAVGFSNNFSTTAIYIVVTISIPIIIFLRKDIVVKKKRKLYYILTIILYIAVLLTGKRAHSLFTLLAGMITYWCLNREKKISKIFYLIGGIFTFLTVFYVISQFFPALLNVLNRFLVKFESGNVLSGREVLIDECIVMFQKNPLFGMGWGSYTFFTNSGYLNAHNVYVQLLAENGIFLSIPFFLFIATNYVHTVKATMKASTFVEYKKFDELSLLGGALFLQTFFLFYCLTGNPLYDTQMLLPYVMSCSIGECFYRYIYCT